MTGDGTSSAESARDHAWRYFELHANHRMSLFNFFLVMAGAAAAGIGATFSERFELPMVGAFLGTALVAVSFVFWKLDKRVTFFIKHAEAALAEAEMELPESARLFRSEPALTAKQRCPWTYGRSFRAIFLAVGLLGFASAALAVHGLGGGDSERVEPAIGEEPPSATPPPPPAPQPST